MGFLHFREYTERMISVTNQALQARGGPTGDCMNCSLQDPRQDVRGPRAASFRDQRPTICAIAIVHHVNDFLDAIIFSVL